MREQPTRTRRTTMKKRLNECHLRRRIFCASATLVCSAIRRATVVIRDTNSDVAAKTALNPLTSLPGESVNAHTNINDAKRESASIDHT